MKHLPVLIVGAGPAGLMAACELARYRIPFRIIDKKAEPDAGSNATWIQTRTLEIFDALGVVDQFLRIGHRCEAINFYLQGKSVGAIPFKYLESSYPFILMLPQSQTERLLTAKLNDANIQIERSVELIDVTQTAEGVTSTVRMANGKTETILSDWLIAGDGANSTVRHKCQFSFPGEDISEQFMVADAKMSSDLPPNEIHVFFDKGTIFPDKGTLFSAFPWGQKEYRLSANLYLSHPRQFFTEYEVKSVVAERTYGNYVVENVSWISPFWIHSKTVDRMQRDAIFLVGDAAHIHSPAGGQGMNTGLQDAHNLAWKLALVILGKAKRSLLESYQQERHAVIQKVVQESEYLTKMALFDKTFSTKLKKFGKNIQQINEAKKAGMELTQLNITYQNSPIVDYTATPAATAPRQGERAPDVKLQQGKNLYNYFRNTQHSILVFTGSRLSQSDLAKLDELQQLVNDKFHDLIRILVVSSENLPSVDKIIILDSNHHIHQQYGVNELATYIVRPDHYIGYYGSGIDLASIEKFFQLYL